MLVKIEKLTFYQFQPNKDLFFYYATTDALTIRGIATPELAEALIDHLENEASFECEIEERQDKSFKLVKLLTPAKREFKFPDLSNIVSSNWRRKEEILFDPKQISLYMKKGDLRAVIKSKADGSGLGQSFFGKVTQPWILWFLQMLREDRTFTLTVHKPSSSFLTNFETVDRDEYLKRTESTYIDNPNNFFCANESPSLKRSDYKKDATKISG